METKDKSSRSGSKINLNESSLPLLDDSELMGSEKMDVKEKIELKEKSSSSSVDEEKDDSPPETKGKETTQTDTLPVTEDVKMSSKKVKRSGHRRSPSCVQNMTVGLNILDRDEKKVNEEVNIQFEDLLAEPDGSHSFDGVWRLAFVAFTGTKFWIYRLLAAICALPCAVFWGMNFALLTFCHIWAITPLLRVIDLIFYFVKRLWSGIVHTICDPVFESIGMLLANIRVHHHQHQQQIA